MNRTTNERITYVMHNLSSLAHDSVMMKLESHSRQALGEDVCWLILTCDLLELHFRLVSRSKFPHSMDSSANMIGAWTRVPI